MHLERAWRPATSTATAGPTWRSGTPLRRVRLRERRRRASRLQANRLRAHARRGMVCGSGAGRPRRGQQRSACYVLRPGCTAATFSSTAAGSFSGAAARRASALRTRRQCIRGRSADVDRDGLLDIVTGASTSQPRFFYPAPAVQSPLAQPGRRQVRAGSASPARGRHPDRCCLPTSTVTAGRTSSSGMTSTSPTASTSTTTGSCGR